METARRARPQPLLHQHVPELGARAPVPDDRPQRRDQHAARQRQLDARARVAAALRAVRRRPREGRCRSCARAVSDSRDARQRPRAARARRPLAAARDDDARPGGLRGPRRHERRAQGLLRLPRLLHGAVGRAGRGRVHRRPRDRRDAGPQRPAPRPLAGDQGRLGDRRLGGRACSTSSRRNVARKGRLEPGKLFLVDVEQGRHRPRRRGQGRRSRRQQPYGDWYRRRAACTSTTCPSASPTPEYAGTLADRQLAFGWSAGGPAADPRADGARRRGADRLDGQRPRAGDALGQVAAAVRLLQAALRAGDQPADRPDPRVDRHVARPAGVGAEENLLAESPEHAHQLHMSQPILRGGRARAPAPGRPLGLLGAHDRHHVADRGGPGRAREGAGAHLRGGRGGRRGRRHRADPVRPQGRPGPRADPGAARRRRRPPPPRARGHAPADRPRHRDGRGALGLPLLRADRLRRRRRQPVPDVRVGRRRSPATAASPASTIPTTPRSASSRRSARACSRRCPRWASRRSRPTAARRSSRRSGCSATSSTATSPAPRRASAASGSTCSPREALERHERGFPDVGYLPEAPDGEDSAARGRAAQRRPVPVAPRRRAPPVGPEGDRGAAEGRAHRLVGVLRGVRRAHERRRRRPRRRCAG